MKDIFKYIKENKWVHYSFIIIVGLLVCIPLFWVQIRTTDDGFLHLIRLVGLDASIAEGDFPFLVFPHICRDFGYSMSALYPPIVTYIPYIIGIISGVFTNGLKIFAALTMILSGIFMYNFVNEMTKSKGISLISALLYITFPYRFEDIFNRFAIGEFTAFIFIPIVFQGLYNLINGDGKKHYYIAIGAIGLLLSHTISTVYTALFCIIYILFNIKKFWKKDIIKKCCINVLFILLITAFFVIPMLEYRIAADYAIFEPDVMRTSGKYTQSRTLEPWQFLKDKGEENGVSFIVGIPMIFMLLSTILICKEIHKKYKNSYIIFWFLGFLSVLMCLKYFPWYYLPDFLNTIQYPWRMIGFAIFFLSPVCAINMYYLIHWVKKVRIRDIAYIAFILIIGIFTVMRLNIYQVSDTSLDKEYERKLRENLVISHFSVNRDYLPYKSLQEQSGYMLERENRIYILEGQAEITEERKEALYFECKILSAKPGTVIELPYIFYPGYTVTLNIGEETIKLDTFESNTGFVCIKIPDTVQNGILVSDYTGTSLEKASYALSGVSFIGFIIYIIWYRKKTNKEN